MRKCRAGRAAPLRPADSTVPSARASLKSPRPEGRASDRLRRVETRFLWSRVQWLVEAHRGRLNQLVRTPKLTTMQAATGRPENSSSRKWVVCARHLQLERGAPRTQVFEYDRNSRPSCSSRCDRHLPAEDKPPPLHAFEGEG